MYIFYRSWIFNHSSVVFLEEDLSCEWVVSTLNSGYSFGKRLEVIAATIALSL
jgi:hypothetical protein